MRSALLILLLFEAASPARAQETARAPIRIGVLFWHDSPNDLAAFAGIEEGLKAWKRPCVIVKENVGEDRAKAKEVLARFDAGEADLVFSMGTEAARAAKEATTRVPVVFTAVTNPVESGIVPDWQGSRRNLAGNSNWIAPSDLISTFCEAIPDLKRLGVLHSKDNAVSRAELEGARQHVETRGGPELVIRVVEDRASVDAAARDLASSVDALWIPIDFLVYENLPRILAITEKEECPLVSSSRKGALEGAVVGLIVDYQALGLKAAAIARRILIDGRTPGEIPIGRMVGFRRVVNLKAAARIGLVLPLPFVAGADEVLK